MSEEKLEQEREYLQKKVENLVGKDFQVKVRPMSEEEIKDYLDNKQKVQSNQHDKSKTSSIKRILSFFRRLK